MKLHVHFNDPNKGFINETSEDEFLKYKRSNSKWVPPYTVHAVDDFISRCKEEVGVITSNKKPNSNLSQKELTALRDLKSRNDIVIKKADKGGAIVVWDKELYIAEGQRQLCDNTFYEKVSHDCTSDINKLVNDVVEEEISIGNLRKGARVLIESNPRCGRFYLLPKIHKFGNPGRPVVSTVSFPTSLISKFLDDQLQPLVQNLDSFIKDTNHILN